jgi:hypothetical protein
LAPGNSFDVHRHLFEPISEAPGIEAILHLARTFVVHGVRIHGFLVVNWSQLVRIGH